MSSKQDYYELLGVSRDAAADEIKRAFRRQAMKYHPDRNPGDKAAEEKFKEMREAYEVLSSQEKRAAYDRFGHAGVSSSAAGGGPGAGFGGFGDLGDVFGDLGDIFGDIFGGSRGGGRSRSSARPGSDLAYTLTISLEQVVKGATKSIQVPTWVVCSGCTGSGAEKGSKAVDCSTCHGRGQVQMQHGFLAVQQTCPTCGGKGKVIKNPCNACSGSGRTRKTKTLSVKIPAGVDNGDRIRLVGEGEAGMNGGAAGDLYVEMRVKPHEIFTRDGENLRTDVPITFVKAALGGEVEVPTMSGQVKLTIPPETQSGKVFRLRGKGIKVLRGNRIGDLLCRIAVETPVNLDDEQAAYLRSFDELLKKDGKSHSPKAGSWFNKVKQFFTD